LYTGHRLDYTLRLWAPTSASRVISVIAELLVIELIALCPLRKRAVTLDTQRTIQQR